MLIGGLVLPVLNLVVPGCARSIGGCPSPGMRSWVSPARSFSSPRSSCSGARMPISGRNWSPSMQIVVRHEIVTTGIYARIRRPMYLNFWLWAFAQLLLAQNWLVGPFTLVVFAAMYSLRVDREQAMMREHLGAAYDDYMRRTGRQVPRWRSQSQSTQ